MWITMIGSPKQKLPFYWSNLDHMVFNSWFQVTGYWITKPTEMPEYQKSLFVIILGLLDCEWFTMWDSARELFISFARTKRSHLFWVIFISVLTMNWRLCSANECVTVNDEVCEEVEQEQECRTVEEDRCNVIEEEYCRDVTRPVCITRTELECETPATLPQIQSFREGGISAAIFWFILHIFKSVDTFYCLFQCL